MFILERPFSPDIQKSQKYWLKFNEPMLHINISLLILSYCNIVWGSNYKSYFKHLNTLHKRVIRIICGLPWYASTKTSFHQLHLLTLENTNSYQILLFMFSFYNSLLPKSLENTTDLDIQKILKFTLAILEHPLTIWTKLPNTLKDLCTLGSFKTN